MLTPYPQIVEYNEAVQHPQTAFRDPELQQGRIKLNALGLPVALSGGFALTYEMTTPRRRLALRCFHRDIVAGEHKYAALTRVISRLNSAYFVYFDYLADGIRIRGGYYPVLKMDWADGDPLGIWLDSEAGNGRRVHRLREAFAALAAYLEDRGIAHGDIQNGNVIVSPSGLKLIDYDGMYVPGMPAEFGCESGHRHFQHPRRTAALFGPTIDRFSFIAVDLSLAALLADPSLYRRFSGSGETILFRAADFAAPEHSEVLGLLARHAGLRVQVENFAAICRADVDAVPSLADFRAGRNIPRSARPAAGNAAARTQRRPAAASNRRLVGQLLSGMNSPRSAPAPRSPTTRARMLQVPPARSNREIVAALGPAVEPPAGRAAGAVPTGSLLIRPRPAMPAPSPAAASVVPATSRARRTPIPRTGSFVIRPRMPPPQPRAAPQTAPAAAAPARLWDRVLRFFGIVS